MCVYVWSGGVPLQLFWFTDQLHFIDQFTEKIIGSRTPPPPPVGTSPHSPDLNVVSNEIIVSNKLLGLLRLGLGFGSGLILYA